MMNQRNARRVNRNHRHKLPKAVRQGRNLQSGTGVGHRDMVIQRKKWMLFTQVPYDQVGGVFAYGLANINISTTGAGIANTVYDRLISQAALSYEEYRVRRVTVFAQPGTGFTNDDRIKASIFARVDVNSQPTITNFDNLNSLICSESSVNRTFTERSNVKLVDYAPICFSTGGTGSASRPILLNRDQWYNIDERGAHLWRGATVAPVIPETGLLPDSKFIVVWAEVELDFRSRRPDFANFSFNSVTPRIRDIDNDYEPASDVASSDKTLHLSVGDSDEEES